MTKVIRDFGKLILAFMLYALIISVMRISATDQNIITWKHTLSKAQNTAELWENALKNAQDTEQLWREIMQGQQK